MKNATQHLRNLIKLCFTGLWIFISACNQPQKDFIKETYPEEQAKIAQSIEDIFQAGKAKDFVTLEGFHLNSPKFTKYDNDSPLRQDYAQNTEYEKATFSAVDSFNYKINELKVDVFGNVAIATFVMPFDAVMQGTKLIDTARSTLVFVNDAGKWKITHEHFSKFKAN